MKQPFNIKCVFVLFLLAFFKLQSHGQTLMGKWRWAIKGTTLDLQSDYVLDMDLTQKGDSVYGIRTLFLKNYPDVIMWMAGTINPMGVVELSSQKMIQFLLPDTIFVAKDFTYKMQWNKADKDFLSGKFLPQEDSSRIEDRKLNPAFYDKIYKAPQLHTFKKISDNPSKVFDSIYKIQTKYSATKPLPSTPVATPKQRKIETVVQHSLIIPNADVMIELYDNGTIDGDIVTVYVNNKVESEHQKLSVVPIQIKIKKEDLQDSTMVIMQAENLGDLPPNTGLMLITVAGKRYDFSLSSTLQKSAAIMLYKKKN